MIQRVYGETLGRKEFVEGRRLSMVEIGSLQLSADLFKKRDLLVTEMTELEMVRN